MHIFTRRCSNFMQNYHNIQIVDANEYSASKYILQKVEVPELPSEKDPGNEVAPEFLLTVIRSVESRDRLHGICIQEG